MTATVEPTTQNHTPACATEFGELRFGPFLTRVRKYVQSHTNRGTDDDSSVHLVGRAGPFRDCWSQMFYWCLP